MKDETFKELVESVREGGQILRGEDLDTRRARKGEKLWNYALRDDYMVQVWLPENVTKKELEGLAGAISRIKESVETRLIRSMEQAVEIAQNKNLDKPDSAS